MTLAVKEAQKVFENPSMDKILKFEEELGKLPQVDLQTQHSVTGGVYARTVLIPAGCAVVGAIHSKDHISVFIGDVTCTTDEGMKRMTGHHVFPCKSGIKRVVYAHINSIWTTCIKTDETELDKIEKDCTIEYQKLQTLRLGGESRKVLLLEGE